MMESEVSFMVFWMQEVEMYRNVPGVRKELKGRHFPPRIVVSPSSALVKSWPLTEVLF